MRKIGILVMLCLLLSGCGFLRNNSYVVVTPHSEDYGVAVDSDVITVNGYLRLKNAMLGMIQDGAEERVIRAESYAGDLSEDLSKAVFEVTQQSPLGAYAVANMTYDYSRIVSYYEIHINTRYKRTREELDAIEFITDTDGIRARLEDAMEQYQLHLVLRVGDYDSFDLAGEVERIYREHPEYALELPESTVELYPESGSQRILDIHLSYVHTPEELTACRDALKEQVEALRTAYGSANSAFTNARRLYDRLGRDCTIEQNPEVSGSLSGGAYGALLEGRANSTGLSQGYRLLLEACGIPCELVSGQKDGLLRDWCRIELEGQSYYVDPILSVELRDTAFFLMGDRELNENGYVLFDAGDYPASMLPGYLAPMAGPPPNDGN